MKKNLIIILTAIMCASCGPSKSIQPEILGGKGYDSARCVAITKDYYAMAGMTDSMGLGGVDAYLVITDKKGRLKYQETYGGKGDDRAFGITVTADGGFMIAGYTTSYGAGNTDVYLVKTGEKGKYISSKVFGGKGFDTANSICRDYDKGFVIAGNSSSFSKDGYRGYIIKTDSDGNCVWTRTTGGKGNEMLESVVTAGNGNFIAVGQSNSKDLKLSDYFAVKFDADGNIIWEKYYGGIYADSAHSIIGTRDNNFIIAGETGNDKNGSDIGLLKINTDGAVIWEKNYGGLMTDAPKQVIETSDGGLFVGGTTESQGSGMSDVWLFKTDKDGAMKWQRVFGGRQDDYTGGVAEDTDRGLVFAGWTRSYSENYDIYFMKLDRDGGFR